MRDVQTMKEEIAFAKRALREQVRRRTAAMSAQEAADSSGRIARDVLSSPWYREARSVFLYISVGKEPDTRFLLRQALEDGKEVYVPRCREKPVMDAVRLTQLEALRPNQYGIPEPEDGETAERIDLTIVPCLSVSPAGDRLGHGGGYYDAFLQTHPCRTLCLCHRALILEDIPHGEEDVPMDALTFGEGIILCRKGC